MLYLFYVNTNFSYSCLYVSLEVQARVSFN
jgi:hypothetical protein